MKFNLEFILKYLPIRGLVVMILDYFKARAKETETEIDDIIERIIRLIVDHIDFDTFRFNAKFFEYDENDGADLIRKMMLTLKQFVDSTEYEFDNIIYSILEFILKHFKLLK